MAAFPLFVVAALVLAVTPGPAVLYIVARSVSHGRLAGIVSCLGVASGNLVHVCAAALGLSALLASSATAFGLVKYLGAAYLVALGLRTLAGKAGVAAPGPVERRSLRRIYAEGVVVNVLNPKTALFFLAFLPQFVEPSAARPALQLALLGATFALIALSTDCTWALLAGAARRFLTAHAWFPRSQRYVSGTIYLGLGLATAAAGRK